MKKAKPQRTAGYTERLAPIARFGRNVRCPCGSGYKWKHCHGAAPSYEPPTPRPPATVENSETCDASIDPA